VIEAAVAGVVDSVMPLTVSSVSSAGVSIEPPAECLDRDHVA
jgi:hypothetical protein